MPFTSDHPLVKLWQKLVEPGVVYLLAYQRRQSRLLASILVFIIPILVLLIILSQIGRSPDVRGITIAQSTPFLALCLLILVFFLNRIGRYNLAASLTVITMIAASFISAFPEVGKNDTSMLYYLVFPVLISSILLSVSITALFVLAIMAGLYAFSVLTPGVPNADVPVYSILLISLVVLLGAEYRTLLERDRQKTLVDSEKRFRMLVEHASEAIVIYDVEKQRFHEANQSTLNLFDCTREDLLQIGFKDICPDDEPRTQSSYAIMQQEIEKAIQGQTPMFECTLLSRKGTLLPCSVRLLRLPNDGKLIRGSIIDLAARKHTEEYLMHVATHDPLTDLPNRTLFNERLNQSILMAKRTGQYIGIFYLDLDNFKDINDAFSHKFGDQILQLIGSRLTKILRESDTIARLAGDEFSILFEGIKDPLHLAALAEKVLHTVSEPIHHGIQEIYLTTSIGISVFPQNGDSIAMLTQNADVALHHAKTKGKNTFQFYSTDMETNAHERVSMGAELRHAMENQKFELYFQPQLHIKKAEIRGFEVLLRWPRPEKKYITPAEFIPVIEETGLILPIGEWVLRQACEQNVYWQANGFPPVIISVNIAEKQLLLEGLVELVGNILHETGLQPNLLELELTENIILQNASGAKDTLWGLHNMGVSLAIDDFGTGYSTLSQLTRLPIDILKIDQSFASRIISDPKEAAVVSGIISIAKELGLTVIAEGVERADQFEFYESHGCDMIQGYYFSRPLPEQPITDLWKRFLEDF